MIKNARLRDRSWRNAMRGNLAFVQEDVAGQSDDSLKTSRMAAMLLIAAIDAEKKKRGN